ncbi:hypothetical protein IKH79_02090 [Candidatus Saccharibacteria bacterium]|nr:hypothetical protein [Candidatus Saccharibacteria bacterium]
MDKNDSFSNIAALYSKAAGTEFVFDGDHMPPTDEQLRMLKAALAYRLTSDQFYVIVKHFGLEGGPRISIENIALLGRDSWEVYCDAMNALGRNPLPPFPITTIDEEVAHKLGSDESIKHLGLSTRTLNALFRSNIYTIEDLLRVERGKRFFCRNFGDGSRKELEAAMAKAGYANFSAR